MNLETIIDNFGKRLADNSDKIKQNYNLPDEIIHRLRTRGYKPVGSIMTKEDAHAYISGLAANDPNTCYNVCVIDLKYIPVKVTLDI